ncbi:Plasminogen-binding protein PgbA [Campylobacter majalis]|uniref:Plasminogen-binding protein PgbA n=1 Tax=Campylobacter majalis TaxID=2790656 RepID=A0ABM8Q849_9BACT|nr:plasminogen-binding N-terminal domain-containing protein [Campylobacter majalis]CAD7289128.1 Plasminogen-binding protein PgbA [Campylobacter majalis]
MKKILLSFVFALNLLYGVNLNFKEYKTPIIDVEDDGTATIVDAPDIVVGSSGVVVHKFSSNDSSIIARVSVLEKNKGFAKIRFEVFDSLEQKALPLPGIAPKSGDYVILNFLYSRAVIVVPNKEIFDEITNAFSGITFIHPDIVGAYLSYEYKPNPSRDDFRKMCSKSAAGLIFIAMNNRGVFADCQSFKVIKEFQTGEVEYYQLPFYTRVRDIDTIFFKLDSAHINNYDAHYERLLEE